MRRKVTEELLRWKESGRRTCPVVKGPRQVGKTYAVSEFGRKHFPNFVYFDLSTDELARAAFSGSLTVDSIIVALSAISDKDRFVPYETLIFLDEIQDCPRARTALKPFAVDGRYKVIASGSLLGLRRSEVPSYPVGYEEVIEMHPMDFEEFVWALGTGTEAVGYVRDRISAREPIGAPIMDIMMQYLRWYMVVGGMPEAVSEFSSQKKLDGVRLVHRKIMESYVDDIAKHAKPSQRTNVYACLRSIGMHLARENKRFVYSDVGDISRHMDRGDPLDRGGSEPGRTGGSRPSATVGNRDYVYALNWLQEAGISTPCFNLTQPTPPLTENERGNIFKLYMMDTGLLLSTYDPGFRASVINGDLSVNRGAVAENMVAQMLTAQGYGIRYYRRDRDEDGGSDRIEVDFILPSAGPVLAVEVKSGGNRSCRSLNKLISRYDARGIMFETRDIFTDDKGVVHYPLFAAAFMDCIDPEPEITVDFGIVDRLNSMFEGDGGHRDKGCRRSLLREVPPHGPNARDMVP